MIYLYLDTQDYLNIFYEKPQGPRRRILEKLLMYRDDGIVALGFSFAIILETLTKPDKRHQLDRARLGALIKDICGPNCFRFPLDIVGNRTFSNEGQWLFSKAEDAFNADEFYKLQNKEFVSWLKTRSNHTRHERRAWMKKGLRTYLSKGPVGSRRMKIPILVGEDDSEIKEVLFKFLEGRCSAKQCEREVHRWYSHPSNFCKVIYSSEEQQNLIDSSGSSFGGWVERLAKVVASLEIEVQKKVPLKDNLSLKTKVTTAFTEIVREEFGDLKTAHFDYYLSMVDRGAYALKSSDIMDLVHMIYAYDCDLFRCDKAMASVFQKYPPFQGKLVGRFEELPSHIERISRGTF